MIKHLLFDLDGTLLPMDQDKFTKNYFTLLAKKLAPLGYEPNKLIQTIWTGTKAMVNNDGKYSNEKVFWNTFSDIYGPKALDDMEYFSQFYLNDFKNAQNSCGYNALSAVLIETCKSKGFDLYLATNPIFPFEATKERIRWAGLNIEDFNLVTTYENSCHCKPNPDYFQDILNQFHLNPDECLMIGNDVIEDTSAAQIGIDVFLITDTLENKNNLDYSKYKSGSMNECIDFIKKL